MNVIQNLITDLREKRLWPVAAALVIALIAVPVLLSGGGNTSVPVAQLPPVGSSAPVPALPAVSVTTTPSNARLTGPERNPFAQQAKKSSRATGSKSSTSATSSKTKASSGSTKASTVSGATTGGTTTVTSTTTTTTVPTAPTAPTTTGLTVTQAYHVAISLTNSTGGIYAVDPVERLSIIPREQLPLLVELGVLSGGHRVLFTVQPGTVVRGPGTCTPGPIDCQILSLAPNQTEAIASGASSASVSGVLMAVTAITADHYGSSGQADQARLQESAAGRRLLNASNLSALSLFSYRPSLGALVDLSNVTVGGS